MKPGLGRILANILVIGMFIAAFAGVAVFAYWTLESRNVSEITNGPVPVRPGVINPEDVIIASPRICKYISKQASIERYIVSKSAKIQLPNYPSNLALGCHTYDIPIIIPSFVTDDTYHIEYNVSYTMNPVTKPVLVQWITEDFQVLHDPPTNPSYR